MEIGLLGALEVLDDRGGRIDVPGAKRRALLAALALRPGEAVSSDRLVEEVWGDDSGHNAMNALQALVSKLRRALPPEVLVTRPTGYLLDLPAESVDIGRFEMLALRGRKALAEGDAEAASAVFAEALAMWRGPPLAEFEFAEFAQTEIRRLCEERLSVLEDRIESDLLVGRHAQLIAELESAVSAAPLRERLRGQLMLALYRSGRQADALHQFQEARRILGEELGLEPGPELRRLEAAILTHDPALAGPAARTGAPRAALPLRGRPHSPPTPTIGRTEELASLAALVASRRLVTLVGPGGVGKTRLALETGIAAQDAFRDGVCLVELASLRGGSDIVTAIASTLGILDRQGPASADVASARLAEILAEQELLLVLDNCEHLVDQSAGIAEELLESCPRLHLLTTSREPLGLRGEVVSVVRPLGPDDAAELFAARAGDVVGTSVLTESAREIVTEICARLDGLPLAIELAAARVRTFPVTQIAERLGDRFALLTMGARTADARQQTMRAVVDWSYELLSEAERMLFDRLSLFVDGCDFDAVQSVCADDLLPVGNVGDLLARLVDKSLVMSREEDGRARFSMLQTLVDYALERLIARGELAVLKARHAAWYALLADRGRDATFAPGQGSWIREVRRERGNLGLAIESSVEAGDAEVAVRVAGGLGAFWWAAGNIEIGLRWLDTALGCGGPVRPGTRGCALSWKAMLSMIGLRPGSTEMIDEAMRLLAEAGDVALLGITEVFASAVYLRAGVNDPVPGLFASSRDHYLSLSSQAPVYGTYARFASAMLARTTGDNVAAMRNLRASVADSNSVSELILVVFLGHLADVCEELERYSDAVDALERARRMAEELGMVGYDVPILARLSNLVLLGGEADRADSLRREAVDAARLGGCLSVLASAFGGIAARQLRLDNLTAATNAAGTALVLSREADDAAGSAACLATLGWTAEKQGDTQAAGWFARGLAEARRAGAAKLSSECAEGLAAVALLQGDGVRAARLLGAASHLHTRDGAQSKLTYLTTAVMLSAGSARDRIERAAREKIGDEAFIEAFAAGGPDDLADAEEAVTGWRRHELQVRSDPHDPMVAGSNRGPATL